MIFPFLLGIVAGPWHARLAPEVMAYGDRAHCLEKNVSFNFVNVLRLARVFGFHGVNVLYGHSYSKFGGRDTVPSVFLPPE